MEGWIKLHRAILDNDLWKSEPFSRGQAWVDLLLLANHKESFFYKRGNKVIVKRGQVGRSSVEFSDRWKWSRTKINKFLKDLEKEQQIVIHKSTITQLITIVNYDTYQEKEQQTGQQKDSRKTAERQQKDTYKNDKKEREEEKKEREFPDISPRKNYEPNDKRKNKQLPFDVVSSSETIKAAIQDFNEVIETVKNAYGIIANQQDIEKAMHSFSTVAVATYDKYKCIRNYTKLVELFIDWIPRSVKHEENKPKEQEQEPQTLEDYYKNVRKWKAQKIAIMKRKGILEEQSTLYEKEAQRIAVFKSSAKNVNITEPFIFDLCFGFFSKYISGNTPEAKLDSFNKILSKENEYTQKRGDVVAIMTKEQSKKEYA